MVIISLPIIKHGLSKDKKISDENRILAQIPTFPVNIDDLKSYTDGMNNYLSDQFGFRSKLIGFANIIRYFLFNETTSKQLTIGQNGFIFYNSHKQAYPNSIIKLICNDSGLSQNKMDTVRQSIINTIQHFTKLGYVTDAVIAPTKSRIYPEYLPLTEKNWCQRATPTWLEKSISQLDHIFYPLELMLKLKQDIQVYLPKHFHWNGSAPYIIAQEIMQNKWGIVPDFKVTPIQANIPSDLNKQMKGVTLFDSTMKYDYQQHDVIECKGRTCLKELNTYYKNGSIISLKRETLNKNKLLLITDSFGAGIAPHFIRGFKEVTLLNLNHLTNDEQIEFYPWVLNTVKPTHILFVSHDYGTYGMFTKFNYYLKKTLNINPNN